MRGQVQRDMMEEVEAYKVVKERELQVTLGKEEVGPRCARRRRPRPARRLGLAHARGQQRGG